MGDIRTKTTLGVATKLAVKMLLGTAYIDQHVKEIFPLDRCIVPLHSESLAILAACDPPINVLTDKEESIITSIEERDADREQLGRDNDPVSTEGDGVADKAFLMLSVARRRIIRPMATASLLVRSTARGL